MPSFSGTTATLAVTGGSATFIPPRFSGTTARLLVAGGVGTFSVGGSATLSVTVPTLDRLTRYDKPQNIDDVSWQRQMAIWQKAMEQIEAAFTALSSQVTDNTNIISQIQAAMALATAANDNATEAVDSINIANSYVSPVSVLTASSAGVVTVAAHNRYYGDGSSVSVDAGSVSGYAPGDYVTVYYVDAAREGGAVTYQGSTDAIAQTGNTHVVGQIVIPASGAADSTGTSPTAPGWSYPDGFDPNKGYGTI